jgi:hemolysin D
MTNPAGLRREFLPAAMALEATPPNPAGRWLLWIIMAIFVVAVTGFSLGQVDVIASAEGQVVPSGRIRSVQAATSGVVATILVADGDRVQAGEVLILLDSTHTKADLDRIQQAIRQRLEDHERHTAMLSGIDVPGASGPVACRSALLSTAEIQLDPALLWRADRNAYGCALQVLRLQAQARASELAQARASAEQFEKMLPLLEERISAQRLLVAQQMLARTTWLEAEQAWLELEGQHRAATHRVEWLEREVAVAEEQMHRLYAETWRDRLNEIGRILRELDALREEEIQARALLERHRIVAPVTGTIHDLQINTPGAVVQAGQAILGLVPDLEPLRIEAWVPNRDIGFLRVGQLASIKVHAFPFTRHGTVPGELEFISHDAVRDDRFGARYLAQVRPLPASQPAVDLGDFLVPGMTVTVEIATGQRRLIEFLAAPLVAALNEAGRER